MISIQLQCTFVVGLEMDFDAPSTYPHVHPCRYSVSLTPLLDVIFIKPFCSWHHRFNAVLRWNGRHSSLPLWRQGVKDSGQDKVASRRLIIDRKHGDKMSFSSPKKRSYFRQFHKLHYKAGDGLMNSIAPSYLTLDSSSRRQTFISSFKF